MKQSIIHYACMLFILAACADFTELNHKTITEPSNNISLSEINRIDFSRIVSPQTKSGNTLSKEIIPIIEGADTLLYIINYGREEGWVLASADKRMPQIVALSKKGRFDLNSASRNTNLAAWMNTTIKNDSI